MADMIKTACGEFEVVDSGFNGVGVIFDSNDDTYAAFDFRTNEIIETENTWTGSFDVAVERAVEAE